MTLRVPVKPDRILWARERAGIEASELARRFPKYLDWESGTLRPTFRQLEALAKFTRVPFGAFFLTEPLKEDLPIPDLRTVGSSRLLRPSADLRDTLYVCQQRQDWYREFAQQEGESPLPFVGSAQINSDVEQTASVIRRSLAFGLDERIASPTWTDALRRFVEQADARGILVMTNGIVGNNTSRKLDPNEFRGFALVDDYAPLIFVNGADSKAAQIFTLAHELAHIWLGESAISNVEPISVPSHSVEKWCNQVAAEILVPITSLRKELHKDANLTSEFRRLARHYKVSTLVILRRLFDAGELAKPNLMNLYRGEVEKIKTLAKGSGGSFHPTLKARVGHRFGSALVRSTLAGQTPFTEAFRYLGISKTSTLREFGKALNAL